MKKTVASIMALAALASPAQALAQGDAGSEGYQSVLGQVGTVDSAPAAAPSQSASAPAPTAVASAPQPVAQEGSLPFTGSEAGLMALFGGLLIAAGFGLRRLRLER